MTVQDFMNPLQARLENACIDVVKATDSQGLAIILCRDPMNMEAVKADLRHFARVYAMPGNAYLQPNGEETVVRNIKLLAACLEAHMVMRRGG